MSTGKLYQEAMNEANDLVKMAEERARDKLIESVMPRIRNLLEKRILEDKDEDSDDDLLLSMDDDELDDEDDESSEEDLDMSGLDDLEDASDELPASPPAPSQTVADQLPPVAPSLPPVGSDLGSLDIKVPSGVKKVTLSVESKSKKNEKSLVDLNESNIQDLIKLVDGRGTLVERARSLQLELKMLRRELDALSGRRKQLRAGGRIVEEFNAILRKAIGLKQEIMDAVKGPISESAKLELTKIEKEIKEMSTKTLLRSLLSEGKSGKLNEEMEETEMSEADDMEDDAGDEGGDEGGDDAVASALQSAMDALKQAADAAGVDLEGGDEDMGDEPLDAGDEEEEEEQEEGHMLEIDEEGMYEAEMKDEEDCDEADKKEGDDLEESDAVYEIDESMLRRELQRLRSLREAANGASAMAHHFGGGKAGSDLFEKPARLNKSDKVTKNESDRGKGRKVTEADAEEEDDKKKEVKESRRNRELVARLKEATKVVEALSTQLKEQKLFNAKLLYVNKLMQSSSLTDKQFRSIVEALDSAKNLREAHLLYTSLSESLTKTGRSLSEGARTAGGSSRPVAAASSKLNEGAVVDRWALLAGINK